MRKILGVNISHNCSFAYFENDILKEYYEEDRFNKIKNIGPFKKENYKFKALEKYKETNFDMVVFVSYFRLDTSFEEKIIKNILDQIKYKDALFCGNEHHIFHAISGYYFSKLEEAICLICDGGGELYRVDLPEFRVMESIFHIKKYEIKCLYKHFTMAKSDFWNNFNKIPSEETFKQNKLDIKLSNKLFGGLKFSKYMIKAGFDDWEEGQLMGIAAYEEKNNLNSEVLRIAKKAQKESLEERIELVEKAMSYSDCKNIILSGGYHLNCSNNFKLVKHFPKLNFFVDPIAHDGGTAVGAAAYNACYKK